MKICILSLLFCMVLTTSLKAQSEPGKQQTEVHQSLIKFFESFSKLDTVLARQYLAQDFILIEDGVIWNTDSLITNFKQLKNQMKTTNFVRINQLDFIKTEIIGKSAWVAYQNTANLTFNNVQKRKMQWIESAFLIKKGSSWKIKMLHSTVLPNKKKR